MKNRMFVITKEEQQVIEARTSEIVKAVENVGIREGLIGYAEANGYTREEACDLIDKIVIPTVDEYNTSCQAAFDGDVKVWMTQKMEAAIEKNELNEQEAAKYKLGILMAIHKLNADAVDGEDEVLTEDEKAMLETGEFTPEMIEQIDEALLESIEGSAMPLYMTEAFEAFLDSNADEENIQVVVGKLWKDNELKYCTATAMCIARHNDELPSIPEETTDVGLILGACQGVDVVNIETKVGKGEMAVDVAYKILKIIGAVVLTLFVIAVLLNAFSVILDISLAIGYALFGRGLVGVLAALGLACCGLSSLVDVAKAWKNKGIVWVGKVSDIAYNALKRGAKTLYNYTVEHIVPGVKNIIASAKSVICDITARVHQFSHSKTMAFVKA